MDKKLQQKEKITTKGKDCEQAFSQRRKHVTNNNGET